MSLQVSPRGFSMETRPTLAVTWAPSLNKVEVKEGSLNTAFISACRGHVTRPVSLPTASTPRGAEPHKTLSQCKPSCSPAAFRQLLVRATGDSLVSVLSPGTLASP